MLLKFEQNRNVQQHEILNFLTKKSCFLKPFWQSYDTILKDVSVAETIV